jgi:uncharacterized PurR-regulated membrane protein YhhQ (DUF165 family)
MQNFRLCHFGLVMLSGLALVTSSFAAKDVTVSVVIDGPSAQWDAVKAVFLDDLVALTEQEFVIHASVSQLLMADGTARKSRTH